MLCIVDSEHSHSGSACVRAVYMHTCSDSRKIEVIKFLSWSRSSRKHTFALILRNLCPIIFQTIINSGVVRGTRKSNYDKTHLFKSLTFDVFKRIRQRFTLRFAARFLFAALLTISTAFMHAKTWSFDFLTEWGFFILCLYRYRPCFTESFAVQMYLYKPLKNRYLLLSLPSQRPPFLKLLKPHRIGNPNFRSLFYRGGKMESFQSQQRIDKFVSLLMTGLCRDFC